MFEFHLVKNPTFFLHPFQLFIKNIIIVIVFIRVLPSQASYHGIFCGLLQKMPMSNIAIIKTTCPICKGSGKLPVTQEPKAETHSEETIGECPTCQGKGEIYKEE